MLFMRYRKGICVVVKYENKFLIFHRNKNWKGWELLKGGRKKGETESQALKREIKEETHNKDWKLIKKFNICIEYPWPKEFIKDHMKFHGACNKLYLIRFNNQKIKIDKREHSSYRWVTKKQALKLLTYHNLKRALRMADKYDKKK